MRIVSMEKGDEIKRIISRFSLAMTKQGHDFMHNDHSVVPLHVTSNASCITNAC